MILHLVRHPPVVKAWQNRCYGHSDPGLSREGVAMVAPLVDQLTALNPDIIIHSDMKRTRAIAQPLARRLGLRCIAEPLWRERNFGTWEGQSWNSIYRATGKAMDGMIDEPDHFRPGGGETTADLAQRVRQALVLLSHTERIVIISHGGSIACAVAMHRSTPLQHLAPLVPSTGSITTIFWHSIFFPTVNKRPEFVIQSRDA